MKPQKKNEKTLLRMKEYLENVYKTVNIVRIKEIPFIKKETNSTNAFNKLAKSVKIKEAEVNNQIKHLGHQTDVVYSSDEEILTDTSDRTVTDDNVIEIPS